MYSSALESITATCILQEAGQHVLALSPETALLFVPWHAICGKNMKQLCPYCSGNLQKLPYLESGYLSLAVFQRPQTLAENSWISFHTTFTPLRMTVMISCQSCLSLLLISTYLGKDYASFLGCEMSTDWVWSLMGWWNSCLLHPSATQLQRLRHKPWNTKEMVLLAQLLAMEMAATFRGSRRADPRALGQISLH